jgi:endonuclease YncB( thermonuclease family)
MRKVVWVGLGVAGSALVAVVLAPRLGPARATHVIATVEVPLAQAAAAQTRVVPPVSKPDAPSPSAAVPALPTVEVRTRPVHAVPHEDPPVLKPRLFDRAGHEVPSRSVSLRPPAAPPAEPIFGGAAAATGGVTLEVAGRKVKLFGVRVADSSDRCGLGPRDDRNCAEVEKDALAQRLSRADRVSCHIPAGQPGKPAAVCVDTTGTDLGGFLVAEGLALADTNESYEYFGAEGVARTFRRGLWRNR